MPGPRSIAMAISGFAARPPDDHPQAKRPIHHAGVMT
jgi:hypothetical protein